MSNLKIIADNPALLKELKELLLKQFSFDNISNQMTNENIGQVVRARIDGKILVESAFREIEKLKTPVDKPVDLNPAR